MTDQRERTLLSGLSFRARPCSGMACSQDLIDQAKGKQQQDEPSDGNNRGIAAYLPHLSLTQVGFADLATIKA